MPIIPPIYQTPGTNFHDLNLDWILSQMKTMEQGWDEIRAEWNAEQEIIDQIPDNINAYFTAHGIPDVFTAAITNAVSGEATARQQADAALGTRIDNEITARQQADTGLSDRINAEQSARQTAVSGVQGNVDELAGVVSGHTTAIYNLSSALATETAQRTAQDTALDGRLTTVETAIVGLQGAVRLYPMEDPNAVHGSYAARNPGEIVDFATYTASENFRATVYPAAPYEMFSISNVQMGQAPCAMFLDEDNRVLASVSYTYQSGALQLGIYAVAPPNTAKILVQGNYRSSNPVGIKKYVFRGLVSPFARVMFGGETVPASSAIGYVWKYARRDYQDPVLSTVYPFEVYEWTQT